MLHARPLAGLFVLYARPATGLFVAHARPLTGLFVDYARTMPDLRRDFFVEYARPCDGAFCTMCPNLAGLFPAAAGPSAFFVGFERAQRENPVIYPLQPQNVSVARDPNHAA